MALNKANNNVKSPMCLTESVCVRVRVQWNTALGNYHSAFRPTHVQIPTLNRAHCFPLIVFIVVVFIRFVSALVFVFVYSVDSVQVLIALYFNFSCDYVRT